MGDREGEISDVVSRPTKRAITAAETSRSSGGRGRAPLRQGTHTAGLAAAKTKLRDMSQGVATPHSETNRDREYRLQYPSLTRLSARSCLKGGRLAEAQSLDRGALEAKDRSPVREVVVSSDDEEEANIPRRTGKPSKFYKLAVEATCRASTESLASGGQLTAEEEGAVESASRAARRVLTEAAKSANLNGVVRGNINNACREILEALEYLENRKESEEIRRLKADNKRMREQLALLTAETKALRTAFSERAPVAHTPDAPAPMAEMKELLAEHSRELFLRLGNMLNARMEGIESRLPPEPILRPPLAADRARSTGPQPRAEVAGPSRQAEPAQTAAAKPKEKSPPQRPPRSQLKAVPRIGQRERTPSQPPAPTQPLPQPTWTEVVGRKKKGQQTQKPPKAAKAKKASAPKALNVPKSAAVIVTLKPESEMSYLAALQKVTTTLKLSEVGLESVRVRKSATGARLIEVPGANSGRMADDLAERIKGIIGDVATIHRPTKTADLRITGLDESVTPEDVRTAVVLRGGCDADQVKVSAVRTLASGTGSALVRCPITVASVLAKDGRILVGWSSGQVKALETKPMRCFRCMGVGHTRALCPSPVDRGEWCYRCSKPGHKAATCEATPYCSVCSAAKKPAKHVMGGIACSPPPTRGRSDPATSAPPSANEGIEMDV